MITVRSLVATAMILAIPLPGAHLMATADPEPSQVEVREARGLYTVTARFEVPQAPATALAVLSDYEQIPRFMPDVRTSIVRRRAPGRLVVEQEAESRFMMFSKTVHLVLEVTENDNTIRFADLCGKSFTTYAGAWRVAAAPEGTVITYELTARPGFDVPEFLLKRLLKRDSNRMIAGLQREMAARK
jgi:ribosome-associated toxin RatA of RatAB toxin-antitoxin module